MTQANLIAGSDSTTSGPIAPSHPENGSFRPLRGIRRLGAFLAWVFTGFGLIGAIRRRRGAHFKIQEVTVYAVHRAFFLWALILVGFVGAGIVRQWPGTAHVMGWVYLWVLLYTFIMLLFDMNAARFLLWAGIFSFIWLGSRYMEDLKHVPVLSGVRAYLHHLKPTLDPGFAIIMSWFLLGPWIGALFLTFTNGRKRLTPNEIGERVIGEGSELTDRSGLKFRTRYRDLMETCLGFGAGDLVAIDSNGNTVKRWENILFLFFLWNRLDEILHQRSALVDNAPDDPVEVEDSNAPGTV